MEERDVRYVLHRLSEFAQIPYQFDPTGVTFGDGPVHHLIELGHLLFIAWEDNETSSIIVNPITRFMLTDLEEMGFPWNVLLVPTDCSERIQCRIVGETEFSSVYRSMERSELKI